MARLAQNKQPVFLRY